MRTAVLVAVLALAASVFGQTVPCSTIGVTDSTTCNNYCQIGGATGTFSGSTCTCSLNGVSQVLCPAGANLGDDDDDFSFGDDDDFGSVEVTCSNLGVSDTTTCNTYCQLGGATGTFSGSTCTCSLGGVSQVLCPTTGNVVSADDDDDGAPRNVDDIRTALIAALGSNCTSAVNTAVTSFDIFTCFEQVSTIIDSFDFETATSFDSICSMSCLPKVFRPISMLVNAGCLSPAASSNFNGGDLRASLRYIAALQDDMTAMCTVSSANNELCGNLFLDLYGLATQNTNVTAEQCNGVVAYGNCLGTLSRAASESTSIFGLLLASDASSDITTLTDSLISGCEAAGVTTLEAAATGTEMPTDITQSSASGVTALFGAVAAIAAAVLLA